MKNTELKVQVNSLKETVLKLKEEAVENKMLLSGKRYTEILNVLCSSDVTLDNVKQVRWVLAQEQTFSITAEFLEQISSRKKDNLKLAILAGVSGSLVTSVVIGLFLLFV